MRWPFAKVPLAHMIINECKFSPPNVLIKKRVIALSNIGLL